MLSAFRSCFRKGSWEYFEHWKPKNQSVHLHAGKAFASGLEAARLAFYLEGASERDAVAHGLGVLLREYGDFECPEDSAKSAVRMAGAFEFYFDQYPMSKDRAVPVTMPGGKKGIEFGFVEPIPDVTHPETGQPLLYSGRMDMLCEFSGGMFGEDDKTTSSLGASWAKQWDMRSQFTGYCWGAQKAGFPLQGFLVRGVSILKTKYDTQQAITYRPQWMIERWYEEMVVLLERMKVAWAENRWSYNLDNACNEYGGCPFKKACLSEDPSPWLAIGFQQRRWDPFTREETGL